MTALIAVAVAGLIIMALHHKDVRQARAATQREHLRQAAIRRHPAGKALRQEDAR